VERLTPVVRSIANYRRSLDVLRIISGSGPVCKSGIMAGLGETAGEVLQTMDDLLDAGCRVMTIGQYLQPSKENMEVVEYISPETFEKYRTAGIQKGFRVVESGPLVRSSYHAERHVL
jgi:lipoic acid synthetase